MKHLRTYDKFEYDFDAYNKEVNAKKIELTKIEKEIKELKKIDKKNLVNTIRKHLAETVGEEIANKIIEVYTKEHEHIQLDDRHINIDQELIKKVINDWDNFKDNINMIIVRTYIKEREIIKKLMLLDIDNIDLSFNTGGDDVLYCYCDTWNPKEIEAGESMEEYHDKWYLLEEDVDFLLTHFPSNIKHIIDNVEISDDLKEKHNDLFESSELGII